MAVDTKKSLRNQVLYSIYVRNYSKEGTFAAVQADLDRVKALGTDIIWLLPIHPTGEKNRKGSLGSPYAIRDYRAVNPEFGTLDDFRHLVDAIHARGMKCIIDVVYNHTSPDSWLAENHPEWFYHKPDGSLGNRFGDWWDVADLDYSHPELWDYQIETLKTWARLVDGFRCDVAPLVPLEFWKRARAEVATVRPGCFWLCESVERGFHVAARTQGFASLSTPSSIRRSMPPMTTTSTPTSGTTSKAPSPSRSTPTGWTPRNGSIPTTISSSASLKIMTAPARPTSSRRRLCAATGRPSSTCSAA